MTNPVTPESSERKLAEELRALRFLGEYGSTESLPDDYIDRLVSFILERVAERERRTVEQRNLEIAHGILCIAEGYSVHLELNPEDGYYNITMALCNALRTRVREAALEEVRVEFDLHGEELDKLNALKNNPIK